MEKLIFTVPSAEERASVEKNVDINFALGFLSGEDSAMALLSFLELVLNALKTKGEIPNEQYSAWQEALYKSHPHLKRVVGSLEQSMSIRPEHGIASRNPSKIIVTVRTAIQIISPLIPKTSDTVHDPNNATLHG